VPVRSTFPQIEGIAEKAGLRTGAAPGFIVKFLFRSSGMRVVGSVGTRAGAFAPYEARGLEADHYWFRIEVHAPDLFDSLLDLIFQGQYLGCSCAAAVHYSESMFTRDADVAKAVSAGESGFFHQPRC